MHNKADDSDDIIGLVGSMTGGSAGQQLSQGRPHHIMGSNKLDGISPIQNARGEFRPPRNDEPPQELFTQSFSQPNMKANHQKARIFEDAPLGEQIQPNFIRGPQSSNKMPEPEHINRNSVTNFQNPFNSQKSLKPNFSNPI